MSVLITGDIDVIRYFRRVGQGMFSKVIIPFTRDYAEELVNEFRQREHVATGRMRASTQARPIQNGWSAVVDVPYAEEENMRPGRKLGKKGAGRGTPHRFVEPSLKAMEGKGNSRLETLLTSFLANA